jgi:hypothetical protein
MSTARGSAVDGRGKRNDVYGQRECRGRQRETKTMSTARGSAVDGRESTGTWNNLLQGSRGNDALAARVVFLSPPIDTPVGFPTLNSGTSRPTTNGTISRTRNGRAVAQAIIRRHPTATARVRAQVTSCGICAQSGSRACFLPVLIHHSPIIAPTAAHPSSSIIMCWFCTPTNGRHTKWTQSHCAPRNF